MVVDDEEACCTGLAQWQSCNLRRHVWALSWNLLVLNSCPRVELKSSTRVPLHPAPLISSVTHILNPLLSISQPPISSHHHLCALSPISTFLWLILSCNWTGVPWDVRQHAPVPHTPSPEEKHTGSWSISTAHHQSNSLSLSLYLR